MEITCPECNAKYRVDAASIGDGKKVKCAKCGNTWFQEPDGAPETEEIIDAAVEEETSLLREEADDEVSEHRFKDMLRDQGEADDQGGVESDGWPLFSLAGVAVILLLVLVALFGSRGALTNAIPGMEVFYTSLGFEEETKAQSLLFDRVDVIKEEGSVYKVLGNIINLQNKKQNIPMIEVLPLNEQGVIVADPVTYKFAEDVMEKEESRYFEFPYVEAEPFSDVELKFVVSSETVPMMIGEDVDIVTTSTEDDDLVEDHDTGHNVEDHHEQSEEGSHDEHH